MNNRDRSPSRGSVVSDGSGNLCVIVPRDHSLAGHEATDLGIKGVGGRGKVPKLLFDPGSVEMMEGGLLLAYVY